MYVFFVKSAEFFNSLDEEAELGEDFLEHLHVLIVDGVMQKIVEAKATRDHEHETLVKLCGDLEEELVVIVELETVVLDVIDHTDLLLVEELPDVEHFVQVVSGHLIEVPLLHTQLLLVLLLQHLEVEVEEPLDLGRIGQTQAVDVLEEVLESAEKVGVHLRPLGRKVLLYKYARDKRQLKVRVFSEYAVVRVLNQLQ